MLQTLLQPLTSFQTRTFDKMLRKSGLNEETCAMVRRHMMAQHRYYHNTEHLLKMWNTQRQIRNDFDEMSILDAILFHDIVYVANSSQNEENSSRLWEILAKANDVPELHIERVSELILLTAQMYHYQPSGRSELEVENLWFLDLDLITLADPFPQFCATQRKILREYEDTLPAAAAQAKHAEFFAWLQQQPQIYRSQILPAPFETAARQNIQHWISQCNPAQTVMVNTV